MEYELYIDLFFLTTLFNNYLSLHLSALFLRKRKKYGRLFLGAAIGSAWNCIIVLFPVLLPSLEAVLTAGLIGPVMTAAAFGISSRRELIKAGSILMITSMMIGGVVSLCRQIFWLNDWEVWGISGILCLLGEILLKQVLVIPKLGSERYQVRLFYKGKVKDFLALADSGNRLRVPETGKNVTLISGADCVGFCDQVSGGLYIPYRAVGTVHGMLFAIVFEKMEIQKDREIIRIDRPVVAITREKLSSDQSFSMILPEEYIR